MVLSYHNIWNLKNGVMYDTNSSELMTSVSERCSRAVVEDHATLVLYDYISRTNRSRPALEVGNICISILLNLCKVSATHGRHGWSIFMQMELGRRRSMLG